MVSRVLRTVVFLLVGDSCQAYSPRVALFNKRLAPLSAKAGVKAARSVPKLSREPRSSNSGGSRDDDDDEGVVVDNSGPRLLYCDGLGKSYDGQRWQFRDLSFSISGGARLGLIGVNGVGKSTLMK
jgi:ATPase subunit of ABC transporter with duplicated ATPase domains